MSQNWLRSCSLSVNGTTISGGGQTDLRITFSIEMTTIQSPNPARFRIYNAGPSTIAALKAAEGTKVTFSGGYQGNTGVLYVGDLKQFIGSGHETPVDSYVDLLCAGGDQAYNQARVTKTLSSGWTPQDKLQAAVTAMGAHGITMGLTNVDLTQPKFPRGIPLIGMARQLIREVAMS
ncbi:hypothetical protein, partial [Beijerinckia sp. L45]|uniref:hypothetical protein n=1 Tax=Beijerinckia sp. L45 TaxID=1641855 RepID=UPI001AEEDD32